MVTTVYTPCCDIDITCCENRNGCDNQTTIGVFIFGCTCCSVASVVLILSGSSITIVGVVCVIFGISCFCNSLFKKGGFMTCRHKGNENILNAPSHHDLVLRSSPDDHNDDANDIENNSQSSRNQEVELSLRNIDRNEKSLPLSSWRKKKKLSHNEDMLEFMIGKVKQMR